MTKAQQKLQRNLQHLAEVKSERVNQMQWDSSQNIKESAQKLKKETPAEK